MGNTDPDRAIVRRRWRDGLAAIGLVADDLPAHVGATRNRLRTAVLLTSFELLWFELICIRWIPAYVRYLGYFTNFILLTSFLGMGVGILSARRKVLLPKAPILILLLVGTVGLSRFDVNINSTQVLYLAGREAVAGSESGIVLPVILAALALVFIQLARPLGPLLKSLPPLEAYAFNILGSMVGAAGFFVVSYLGLPPVVWFLVLALVLVLLLPRREVVLMFPFLAGIVILVQVLGQGSLWSPYYRIQVHPNDLGGYVINANNISHQETAPYATKETFYFRVYDLLGEHPFRNVLVLGAGTGSDVAIALHMGAAHVDAVEIDPLMYQLGRTLNPDHPYTDPRVTAFIEDGRSFLQESHARYDLILFALPDSLTLTSGFANLRLESFLLTTDAFVAARTHLADDGILAMYNYYRDESLVRKLAGMLDATFGTPPHVTTYGDWGGAAVLLEGPRLQDLDSAHNVPYAEPASPVDVGTGRPLPMIGQGRLSGTAGQEPATDDWPFLYVFARGVPTVYLIGLGGLLLISLVLLLLAAPSGTWHRFEWHFFFLGAAFMLLETKSLVSFALLFGSTWTVNAIVFLAILCSTLLAVLVSARFRLRKMGLLYVLLFAALIMAYLAPAESLLAISPATLRYAAAAVLAFAPIFLANVIFSHSYGDTVSADIALGSNMLGAMLGGACEYLALAFGYRWLLLPIGAFYALAFLIHQRSWDTSTQSISAGVTSG